MSKYYERCVDLRVMWCPSRHRWESWDTAMVPRVCGIGSTPEEAVARLTESLRESGRAPGWVKQQKREGYR